MAAAAAGQRQHLVCSARPPPPLRFSTAQEGGIFVRRQLLDEASHLHLLLHTGRLEALTCPATIMHRWGAAGGRKAAERGPCWQVLWPRACASPPSFLPRVSPLLLPAAFPCSLRDDVVPLEMVQRLADELQGSSRAFHLELLPVSQGAGGRGGLRGEELLLVRGWRGVMKCRGQEERGKVGWREVVC